jgi:hypothetical protein
MRLSRRVFLGCLPALAAVPYLQMPAAVPGSPVAGWSFLWREFAAPGPGLSSAPGLSASVLVGGWVAVSEGRCIFCPAVITQRDLSTMRAIVKENARTMAVEMAAKASAEGRKGAPRV